MMDHPDDEIIVDDEYNHGQPSLPSGYTVLQVVQLLEGEFDNKSAADRLNVPVEEIRAASAYYRKNREEIEKWRTEKVAVADEHTCDDCLRTDDVKIIEDPTGYGSDTRLCVRCRTRRGVSYKRRWTNR